MSRFEKEKHNSYERLSKREKSSDSESSSYRDNYRRSSSRTDDDDGRSTPEEISNGQYKRDYEKSKNGSKDRERQKRHEKSRHVSNSSTDRHNRKHREYRKDRERDRSRERRRSYSSSDESDSYYRRHKRRNSRSRSRSRDKKSREREPRRSTDSSAQKSGDRRLFPLASDDRNSASVKPSNLPEKEAASWRDGGPLPPPVFIGNQGVAPPPPNISGNVPPQSKYLKEKRSSINDTEISEAITQENCRSSFVPPSYLTMPPHPNSIANNPNSVPPPLALGGRPPVPPPIRPPPGAPPALGHRPPPPPIRPKMQNPLSISSNISTEAPHEKVVKYHEAPKAPKRIEIKPEIKLSPPKVQTSQTKNIAIKLGATAKSKPTALNAKLPAKVASVFGADDSDSEEEMPQEAKMRMRNVGRETITSSGPNSFGKTRQGFTDTKKLYEKNMHKPLFDDD